MDEQNVQQAFGDSINTPVADEMNQTSFQEDAGNDVIQQEEEVVDNSSEGFSENQNEQNEVQRNYEAEKAKYAKLESDNVRFKRQLEDLNKQLTETQRYKQAMSEFESTLKVDKEAWEKFRASHQKRLGVDLGAYETRYGVQTQSNYAGDQQLQQAVQSPEEIEERVLKKIEQRNSINDFVNKFPEFARSESDDDYSLQEKSNKFTVINAWANDLMRENSKLTYTEALEEAYYSRPENREKAIKRAQMLGEQTGRATANAQSMTQQSSVSGYSTTSSSSQSQILSPEEKAIAKRLRLTEDEYKNQKYRK
jgi:hypothetical protein